MELTPQEERKLQEIVSTHPYTFFECYKVYRKCHCFDKTIEALEKGTAWNSDPLDVLKASTPSKYIIFVWGVYKRPNHYSGVGCKNLHSESEDDLSVAKETAKALLAQYSKDKLIYHSYNVVIKGDNGVEYANL